MKRIVKKGLSLILMLLFMLSIAQFNVLTVFADTTSGFTITNGVLTKYNGAGGDVVIPASVTSIGDYAFVDPNNHNTDYTGKVKSNIKSITIPSNVTSIGSHAFLNCNSITSVTIPNSVKSIGGGAFASCLSLKRVTIPDTVKSIGGGAFGGTPWLNNQKDFVIAGDNILIKYKGSQTNAVIPDGVKSIGETAFWFCTNLTSITIPSSVTSIGNDAFGNTGLTSIVIPNTVTSIGDELFLQCNSLTSVTLSNSITQIGYFEFKRCPKLTSITIPNSVKSIGGGAFYGCVSLNNITIPSSVKSIGGNAFGGTSWFDNNKDEFLIVGNNILIKYNGNQTNAIVPDGTKSIGISAFLGCDKLTNITIPNNVTSIGAGAFENCTSLNNITIPKSVTRIGAEAFYGCTGLNNITILNSDISIGRGAFWKTPWFTNQKDFVTVGNNILIEYQGSKTSVEISNSITSIGESAFENSTNITNIIIPSSVTSIGKYAFKGCTSLTNMTIPSSVISIEPMIFYGCKVVTICGEANSFAQTYAKQENIPFKNMATAASSGTKNTNPIKVGNIERLWGNTRYKTAVEISKSGWTQSDNVVIVDGNNYPDALVGTSFAYLKDAPVLTTPSDKLDINISAEIARLGVKTVYILGNKTSISQSVEDELSQKYTVVRIGGQDVFNTAVKVGEEIRKINKFDTIALVAQGGFADALAIAPFSARNNMPILFSDTDSLRADTLKSLQDWGIKNVVIVGGLGVISGSVEDKLKGMGITVTRLAGQDRYDTSLEIIKHFEPSQGYKNISVCTGENYPDALTGAVLAAKNNTPLVLVSKCSVKDNVSLYINKNAIDKAYIFGGTGVLSDGVISK